MYLFLKLIVINMNTENFNNVINSFINWTYIEQCKQQKQNKYSFQNKQNIYQNGTYIINDKAN